MKFTDFSASVRPEVQGCPDFMIERAVRDSSIDFCQRTGAYIPEPEFILISNGVNEYEVTVPAGAELNYIIDIFANRTRLNPVSYPELLGKIGDGTQKGAPKYYSQRDNTQFYLAPIPETADSLQVIYSLKPSSTSSSIPDFIGKENQEAISQGALYRLQMMQGQPFTNPNAASMNKQLYDKQVGRVVRQVKYGFAGGSLTARSREFI